MLIGIDLDDTLADTMSALVKYHNDLYGTKLVKEKINKIDYLGLWQCTEEETYTRFHKFFSTDYYKKTKPIPGGKEAIDQLGRKHELIIITGRAIDKIAEPTHEWLKVHFPDKFSAVHFVNNYERDKVYLNNKSRLCRELGVDVIIDDSWDIVHDCVNASVKGVLFDQPWNQAPEKKGVARVRNWRETIEYVENL